MNANYRRGRNNEYRTIKVLEGAGYACVRAAGSHGPFDVWGLCVTGIILVQVKTNGWPCAAERESLRDFPAPHNATKLIHRWNTRATLPLVQEV